MLRSEGQTKAPRKELVPICLVTVWDKSPKHIAMGGSKVFILVGIIFNKETNFNLVIVKFSYILKEKK